MASAGLNLAQWKPDQVVLVSNQARQTKRYKLERFLGGGRTSLVWKAQELDEDDEPQGPLVALKVLRTETEGEWRAAFEGEIRVLRELWAAEEALGDGWHAVPQVYDISPEGYSPAYLAMEVVSCPSVVDLARPPDGFTDLLARSVAESAALNEHLGQALAALEARLDENDSPVTELAQIASSAERTTGGLRNYAQQAKSRFLQSGGLTEREVALIGAQTCRVLQLLHQSGRSYHQDFQLQNVHWDRKRKQIKVIDWNVTIFEGRVPKKDVQKDLARLASYLFWLRTLVRGPEEGAGPRALSRLGGTIWSEDTALALRMVLARALDPVPAKRFQEAYAWNEADNGDPSLPRLDHVQSLGYALRLVASWHQAPVLMLLANAGLYHKDGRSVEAHALIEIARKQLEQADEADSKRAMYQDELDGLEREIGPLFTRPAWEVGRSFLDAHHPAAAVKEFGRAVQEHPDDLEAHRWLSLAKSLAPLQLDAVRSSWGPRLVGGMRALTEGRWDEAVFAFETSPADLSDLVRDARLCQALDETGRLALRLDTDPGNARRQRARAGEFLDALNKIDGLVAEGFPHVAQVLARWPEWGLWRERAEAALGTHDATVRAAQLRRGLGAEEGFAGAFEDLRERLRTDPGEADLLQAALAGAHGWLSGGNPHRATEVLDVALRYVGGSPYYTKVRAWLDRARAWERLRETISARDWYSATESATILCGTPPEVRDAVFFELWEHLGRACESREAEVAAGLARVGRALAPDQSDQFDDRLGRLNNEIAADGLQRDEKRRNDEKQVLEDWKTKIMGLMVDHELRSKRAALAELESFIDESKKEGGPSYA